MKHIEELYNKYSKQIFNYFYYMTYDTEKANDLTQETFYQVILSIVKFKKKSKVSTWIYGIARNTYLKSLRKEKKIQVELKEEIIEKGRIGSYVQAPEESLEKKETMKTIKKVLNMLPEKYATVLLLRDKEGLSYSDIATITGMSNASVKVNLFRGRKKFKEEFTKFERGEVLHE